MVRGRSGGLGDPTTAVQVHFLVLGKKRGVNLLLWVYGSAYSIFLPPPPRYRVYSCTSRTVSFLFFFSLSLSLPPKTQVRLTLYPKGKSPTIGPMWRFSTLVYLIFFATQFNYYENHLSRISTLPKWPLKTEVYPAISKTIGRRAFARVHFVCKMGS